MKKRDPVAEYCYEWVRWCETRRFYIRSSSSGILARLQPSKVGREPNARNHPDMQYFNMAIHTLADMGKWAAKFKAFDAYYRGDGEVVKRIADQLGIGRRTYYDHVKSFADAAYKMADSIKTAHEAMSGQPAAIDQAAKPSPGKPPAHPLLR